jgi:hypothetical protein
LISLTDDEIIIFGFMTGKILKIDTHTEYLYFL